MGESKDVKKLLVRKHSCSPGFLGSFLFPLRKLGLHQGEHYDMLVTSEDLDLTVYTRNHTLLVGDSIGFMERAEREGFPAALVSRMYVSTKICDPYFTIFHHCGRGVAFQDNQFKSTLSLSLWVGCRFSRVVGITWKSSYSAFRTASHGISSV